MFLPLFKGRLGGVMGLCNAGIHEEPILRPLLNLMS